MAKLHLVLKKKGDQYYFSNPKRQTENELFNCKIDGAKIIFDLLADEIIDEPEATELLTSLLNVWDIPYGKPDALEQFESDNSAIRTINKLRNRLALVHEIHKIPGLPVFRICPNCGGHGRILGRKFMSKEFHSKEVALEGVDEMVGGGIINRDEERKLRQQINESSLPQKDVNENSHLN